jgi:hypothetical protein
MHFSGIVQYTPGNRRPVMQEIGSDANYRVAADKTKNRLYLWALGEIMGSKGIEGMVPATKTACGVLKPGFTALVDFTEIKMLGVPDIVRELQETVMAAGLRKLASVWDRETFAKLVVDSSAQKVAGGAYDTKRMVFHSRAEAEPWLDE